MIADLGPRFWSKVDMTRDDGCWVWTGATNGTGYGHLNRATGNAYPHRLAYQSEVGPIVDGLEIDHLCRNRLCVNPAHLEAVTPSENSRRREAAKPTSVRCRAGHDRSESYRNRRGAIVCRPCRRAYKAAQRKAAAF